MEPSAEPTAPGLRAFSPRARSLAWAAASAAAAASPLIAILAAGKSFGARDTVHLFEPLRPLVVSALREGRLPLWNPHEALGMPLFAQPQHAALHPVTLLAAFLAPDAGLAGVAIAHVALAALGAFVLARGFGASRAAAAVAAVGFGTSGYVLSMTSNLPYLAAAGAAPWAIAALRAAAGGGLLALAGAAAAGWILLLAGDPQWAIVALAAGMTLAWESGGSRGLARAALSCLLALGLAAVQLLPTWALVREASRASAGLSGAERAQFALAPWRTLELVVPGFFGGRPGAETAEVFQRLGGPNGYAAPFVFSVHVGAILAILAILGTRASRATRVLGVLALASAWLAYGVHLGADQLLRWVPVWGSFRYSEKLVGPFALAVAILAAAGTDRLRDGPARRTARIAGGLALAAALSLGAIWLAGDGALRAWVGDAATAARTRLLVGQAQLVAGLAALAGALAAADRPRLRPWLPAALAGLVFLQAGAAAPFALHVGVPGVRERDPLRAARTDEPVTRIVTPSRSAANPGPPELDAIDRVFAQDSRMGVAPFAVPAGIDQVALYAPLWPARFERVFFAFLRDFGDARWIAWRRYSVNRAVVDTRVTPQARRAAEAAIDGARKVLPDDGSGFSVWETPHRPWAGFAEAVLPAPSEEVAYARTAESIATGSAAVVIEDPPPLPTAPGRVLAVERGRERVRIEAEAAGDAVLVVNDAFWPGWTATIDGAPVPILRADVLVRAVAWPAGRHVLEMRYEPREVRTGALASAAAAVVLLGLLGAALLRKRRG